MPMSCSYRPMCYVSRGMGQIYSNFTFATTYNTTRQTKLIMYEIIIHTFCRANISTCLQFQHLRLVVTKAKCIETAGVRYGQSSCNQNLRILKVNSLKRQSKLSKRKVSWGTNIYEGKA